MRINTNKILTALDDWLHDAIEKELNDNLPPDIHWKKIQQFTTPILQQMNLACQIVERIPGRTVTVILYENPYFEIEVF